MCDRGSRLLVGHSHHKMGRSEGAANPALHHTLAPAAPSLPPHLLLAVRRQLLVEGARRRDPAARPLVNEAVVGDRLGAGQALRAGAGGWVGGVGRATKRQCAGAMRQAGIVTCCISAQTYPPHPQPSPAQPPQQPTSMACSTAGSASPKRSVPHCCASGRHLTSRCSAASSARPAGTGAAGGGGRAGEVGAWPSKCSWHREERHGAGCRRPAGQLSVHKKQPPAPAKQACPLRPASSYPPPPLHPLTVGVIRVVHGLAAAAAALLDGAVEQRNLKRLALPLLRVLGWKAGGRRKGKQWVGGGGNKALRGFLRLQQGAPGSLAASVPGA